MGRGPERVFRMGGINLVIHPHDAEKYIELWRQAFRARKVVKLRGGFGGLIGSFAPVRRNELEKGISGSFYKFFDLDAHGNWFDLTEAKPAAPNDLARISIPSNLKPDLVLFNYVFLPQRHKLFFETTSKGKTLSPGNVEKLLTEVFSSPHIEEQFGKVEITVMPRHDSLSRILGMHKLRKVYFEIKKPNPDDFATIERRYTKRLENMKARKMEETFTADSGQSLELDASAKEMAKVAATNGEVAASGIDAEGRSIMKSTLDMPLNDPVTYDPNVQTALDALIEQAYTRTAGN